MKNLNEVIRFLLGEDELDGYAFGEGPSDSPFWWRKNLREEFERANAKVADLIGASNVQASKITELNDFIQRRVDIINDLQTRLKDAEQRLEKARENRSVAISQLTEVQNQRDRLVKEANSNQDEVVELKRKVSDLTFENHRLDAQLADNNRSPRHDPKIITIRPPQCESKIITIRYRGNNGDFGNYQIEPLRVEYDAASNHQGGAPGEFIPALVAWVHEAPKGLTVNKGIEHFFRLDHINYDWQSTHPIKTGGRPPVYLVKTPLVPEKHWQEVRHEVYLFIKGMIDSGAKGYEVREI